MFVIHALNRMGGAENILTEHANYFAAKGYDVAITILSSDEILFSLDERIKTVPYRVSKKYQYLPKKLRFFIQQIEHISQSAREYNPDILVSFVASTNILSTIAAKYAKKPVILAERSSYHQTLVTTRNKIESYIWKGLRRLVYPHADQVIVLTKEDAPKYAYAKDVKVIPNPLKLQNKHPSVERENIILGVGRLHEVKGFDMLISAFAKLNAPEWKLVIAGEGAQRENLERLAKELGVSDRVEMPGLIHDIEFYYKRASIYVLSSRSEGYPGALCEAMGYGCAVVAFDCRTGPKEIISDQTDGILVEAENVDNLANAIDQLIKNPLKRQQMGENAMKISQRLDPDRIEEKWEKSMKDIISSYNKELKND